MAEKIPVNAEFVSLNYFPYEGWGRHRQLITDHLEFKKRSDTKVILANPFPIKLKPGEKAIFLATYESDRVPDRFVESANNAKGLIVPDKWVKEVFSKSGVKVPILVVPEGVTDNTPYTPTGHIFTFTHFDATSYANRKGGDMVLEAFISEFGNNKDVQLIMKGRKHVAPFKQIPVPNTKYVFEDYTDEQMKNLLKETHCFVFPSRGEGFGLPPLEAMAHGIPTILTCGSAMAGFAMLGIPLTVSHKIPAVYEREENPGRWEQPSLDVLKTLMKYVYHEYEEEKKRAVEIAPIIWEKYNFADVAHQLVSAINKIKENEEKDPGN